MKHVFGHKSRINYLIMTKFHTVSNRIKPCDDLLYLKVHKEDLVPILKLW